MVTSRHWWYVVANQQYRNMFSRRIVKDCPVNCTSRILDQIWLRDLFCHGGSSRFLKGLKPVIRSGCEYLWNHIKPLTQYIGYTRNMDGDKPLRMMLKTGSWTFPDWMLGTHTNDSWLWLSWQYWFLHFRNHHPLAKRDSNLVRRCNNQAMIGRRAELRVLVCMRSWLIK